MSRLTDFVRELAEGAGYEVVEDQLMPTGATLEAQVPKWAPLKEMIEEVKESILGKN